MKRNKRSKLGRYNRAGYFFVLPFVIIFLIFNIYPVLRTLYFSFTTYKGFGEPTFNGVENYSRVLQDKFFWRALWNTIRIWGLNIIVQLGIAFILIMVYTNFYYKIKGLQVARIVYYLPNLIATASVAFLFKTLLDWKYGSINQMIIDVGHSFNQNPQPVDWFGNPKTAGVMISLISAWMWFGNSFLILMSAVQAVDKNYYEAAALDGANNLQMFTNITLPLISPVFRYVALTSLIGGLQMFDLPYLIYSGGRSSAAYKSVETVVMYMYKFGFESGTLQIGYASAISYVLFFIILIFSFHYVRKIVKEEVF